MRSGNNLAKELYVPRRALLGYTCTDIATDNIFKCRNLRVRYQTEMRGNIAGKISLGYWILMLLLNIRETDNKRVDQLLTAFISSSKIKILDNFFLTQPPAIEPFCRKETVFLFRYRRMKLVASEANCKRTPPLLNNFYRNFFPGKKVYLFQHRRMELVASEANCARSPRLLNNF